MQHIPADHAMQRNAAVSSHPVSNTTQYSSVNTGLLLELPVFAGTTASTTDRSGTHIVLLVVVGLAVQPLDAVVVSCCCCLMQGAVDVSHA